MFALVFAPGTQAHHFGEYSGVSNVNNAAFGVQERGANVRDLQRQTSDEAIEAATVIVLSYRLRTRSISAFAKAVRARAILFAN